MASWADIPDISLIEKLMIVRNRNLDITICSKHHCVLKDQFRGLYDKPQQNKTGVLHSDQSMVFALFDV